MANHTRHGKAFEYACMLALMELIGCHQKTELSAQIIPSTAVKTAESHFIELADDHKKLLYMAGTALGKVLSRTEPRLIFNAPGLEATVGLAIQADMKGMHGDVRDIVAVRMASNNSNRWEIGISAKHNHDAVKHPRISPTIDIGKEWTGYCCDQQYWNAIKPVFDYTASFAGNTPWNGVKDKNERVYRPLLNAVMEQLIRLDIKHKGDCTTNLLHYLIGENDFYKAMVLPNQSQLIVQGFNLNGTLNLPSSRRKPLVNVMRLKLPTQLYNIDFEQGSTNKICIVMDEGWQISMRIHNAKKVVENSLKMDVRLKGVPPYIFTQTEGL